MKDLRIEYHNIPSVFWLWVVLFCVTKIKHCIYWFIYYWNKMCLVAQSCLTLCDPMDCSPPGSSVHGDSPGKNTGVAMPSSRGPSQPRDWTQASYIEGRSFPVWATREAHWNKIRLSYNRFGVIYLVPKVPKFLIKPKMWTLANQTSPHSLLSALERY